MTVKFIPCGAYANDSERRAAETILKGLQKRPKTEPWVVLSNLLHSVDHRRQSDEIDLMVVGPSGVHVVEVKHWSRGYLKREAEVVRQEGEKLAAKVRKISGRLKQTTPDLGFLAGKFLLTNDEKALGSTDRPRVEGAEFFSLVEWKSLLAVDGPAKLRPDEVEALALSIAPRAKAALDGELQRLGGIVQLRRTSPDGERFHRTYAGRDASTQEKVVLHLYDLSAWEGEGDPLSAARREFEVLQKLQKSPWLPGFQISFREVPNYPGELYYFAVIDPAAPSLQERVSDPTWSTDQRLQFAARSARALAELHQGPTGVPGLCHRRISPSSLLVRADDRPLFTDFAFARLPDLQTIAPTGPEGRPADPYQAPEVQNGGLAAAVQGSDVFSLCRSLETLAEGPGSDDAWKSFRKALSKGTAAASEDRWTAARLAEALDRPSLPGTLPAREPPPARYWSEDLLVKFNDKHYRILSRLGSGGFGTTFKVVRENPDGEQFGTYVAKVLHDKTHGTGVLRAYELVSGLATKNEHLAVMRETSGQWRADSFQALLEWVDGLELAEIVGDLDSWAEMVSEEPEEVVLRWLEGLVSGLAVLHRAGLVHGDVSTKNVLVQEQGVQLIDYDLVQKAGAKVISPGTPAYHPPELAPAAPAHPSHDLFSLAAALFHVVVGRWPFDFDGAHDKRRGLAWQDFPIEGWSKVRRFLDKAASPDFSDRFEDAVEAEKFLQMLRSTPEDEAEGGESATGAGGGGSSIGGGTIEEKTKVDPSGGGGADGGGSGVGGGDDGGEGPRFTPNVVPRLRELLTLYPGGRHGCVETRGLDTPFAADTYVETGLEENLLHAIRTREARLVILCGNAGDGKTAMLQHLASRLGLPKHASSQRLWNERIPNGPRVYVNLDGSASYQGRSADDLLSEFFEPFLHGPPEEDLVHLLAVNDGRLLKWATEREDGGGPLVQQLMDVFIHGSRERLAPHVRLIDLNQRSLVGTVDESGPEGGAGFLDALIDKLLGGSAAAETWAPCRSCTARDRCQARRSAELLLAEGDAEARGLNLQVRRRLARALQAVHLHGEVHITTRELRAALSYILFGIHDCKDLHHHAGLKPPAYYDRAFDARPAGDPPPPADPESDETEGRAEPEHFRPQGVLLRALTGLDPALESHPRIDRYLLGRTRPGVEDPAPRYPEESIASARRRAYFEWSTKEVETVAGAADELTLARGRHLEDFLAFPNLPEERRRKVCRNLCQGVARLEELPRRATEDGSAMGLRITPRTPVETSLWTERPLEHFRLERPATRQEPGVESLHTHLELVYDPGTGATERLRLGAELFYLLMEIQDGYQLSDVLSDDTFANLAIFKQRLTQHSGPNSKIYAWNPVQEDTVFELRAVQEDGVQKLRLTPRGRQERDHAAEK